MLDYAIRLQDIHVATYVRVEVVQSRKPESAMWNIALERLSQKRQFQNAVPDRLTEASSPFLACASFHVVSDALFAIPRWEKTPMDVSQTTRWQTCQKQQKARAPTENVHEQPVNEHL